VHQVVNDDDDDNDNNNNGAFVPVHASPRYFLSLISVLLEWVPGSIPGNILETFQASGRLHAAAASPLGKIPCTHCTVG
jgi:hypothetical protein